QAVEQQVDEAVRDLSGRQAPGGRIPLVEPVAQREDSEGRQPWIDRAEGAGLDAPGDQVSKGSFIGVALRQDAGPAVRIEKLPLMKAYGRRVEVVRDDLQVIPHREPHPRLGTSPTGSGIGPDLP